MDKRRKVGETLLARLSVQAKQEVTPEDKKAIRAILDQGCDWSKARDEEGRSVLHLAAVYWDDAILSILFNHSKRIFANIINEPDSQSNTALQLACKKGNMPCLTFLLTQKDAIQLQLHTRDHEGASPLSTAVRRIDQEMTQALVDAGACVLFPYGSLYNNPLYSSRYHLDHSFMNCLQEDYVKCGQILKILLNQGKPTAATCIELSVSTAIPDIERFLLFAAQKYPTLDLEILQMLLAKEWVSVPQSDMLATWHKNPFVAKAIEADDLERVKILYAQGVDFRAKNPTGGHLLHEVCLRHAPVTFTYLVDELGLDINMVHPLFGETSLHVAAKWGHNDMFFIMSRRGINFYHKDNNGMTALQAALVKRKYVTAKCLAYIPSCYSREVINSCYDILEETRQNPDFAHLEPEIKDMENYLRRIFDDYPSSLFDVTADYIRYSFNLEKLLGSLGNERITQRCRDIIMFTGLSVQDILDFSMDPTWPWIGPKPQVT